MGWSSPSSPAALTQLFDTDRYTLDRETALEIFIEFKSDIHRIAQREFVKQLGAGPPSLLTASDVEG